MKYDHFMLFYLKQINSRLINDNMTRYYSCLTTSQAGSLAKNQERQKDKPKVYILQKTILLVLKCDSFGLSC